MPALEQLERALPPGWGLALLALVLVLVVGARLGLGLARWREARRAGRSRRVGERGERKAARLLERRGYEVVEREVPGTSVLLVDGRPQRYSIRADAIVRRGRRRYVAEFKATGRAASLGNRGTRRQLIEYMLAFETDAVLLVDAEAGSIREVRLPR